MRFSIETRLNNFKKYYNFNNSRPLLGFFLDSEFPLHRYRASIKLPQGKPLQPDDFIVEDYLVDYERLFELHELAGGDFIFSASPFWGIPWLEAALGCEIFADHQTGSIYSEPPKSFAAEEDIDDYECDEPWVQKAIEFCNKIAYHSNGRYPLATPRLRGIADLIAALYGNNKFIFAFMENSTKTKELCFRLTNFFISFAKEILEHIPLFHNGVGSFYYNMWAPSGSIWHQEDATALLNPNIYEQFILPCDVKIAKAFNGCFMHMHPTGFYPYKQLLDTQMTALELHIDAGGPSAEKLYPVHREILDHKPLLIWGQISEKDLDWIFNKLPSQGLAVNVAIESIEQAEKIWKRYIG